jgi:glycine cleavage system regulatory protein
MQETLVMTVIGKDRTGLVESVARTIADHGGNWLESRMCRLGGEFAGILRLQVAGDKRAALEKALAQLKDLTIVVRTSETVQPVAQSQLASLTVVGNDRPGIVREVTHALAALKVNVEELATECVSAPMSGELLFQAKARLFLPTGLTVGSLRQSLEKTLSGLTVDVRLAEL